jgi:hypothetical protein
LFRDWKSIIKYSLEEYMEVDDDFKVLNQLQKAQEVVPAEKHHNEKVDAATTSSRLKSLLWK